MTMSAFGVDDYRIAKADKDRTTQNRVLAGTALAGSAAAYGGDRIETGAKKVGAKAMDVHVSNRVAAMNHRAFRARHPELAEPHEQKAAASLAQAHSAEKWAKNARRVKLGGIGLAAGAMTPLAIRGAKKLKQDAVAKALTDSPKARRAQERKKTGLGVAGVGYLTATRAKDVSPHGAAMLTRSAKKIGDAEHAARVARKVKIMDKVTGHGGTALVAGGVGLAAEGYVNNLRARGKLGKAKKKAGFGKAFDPERQRHRRADFETGALAGGAAYAGTGSVGLAREASRTKRAGKYEAEQATKKRGYAATRLNQMQTKSGTADHVPLSGQRVKEVSHTLKLADEHGATATKLARKSRILGRGAVGTAVGAGALAAGAFGVHRSDRKGSGRSYGY